MSFAYDVIVISREDASPGHLESHPPNPMKRKLIATSLLLAGILNSSIIPRAFAEEKKESQAQLQAKAKITEAQAKTIALAKVPGGKVKEGELEEENGHLVWSFDISSSGTKDITEVQVDANSGSIISVATETPKDEAKEAKDEKKEKKHKGEKEDDDDKDERKP